jgi:hypothetical protein
VSYLFGFTTSEISHADTLSRIVSFSTNVIKTIYDASLRFQDWYTNDPSRSGSPLADGDLTKSGGSGSATFVYPATATTLGNNIYETHGTSENGSPIHCVALEIVSPIHTSSHYQTFETPYLHKLVGGDRNMEQTNLVVTSDGKTWDEVTRDTSYIGNMRVNSDNFTIINTIANESVGDEWRGSNTSVYDLFNKDFAIAYNRVICLVNGFYRIHVGTHFNAEMDSSGYHKIIVNGTVIREIYTVDGDPAHGGVYLSAAAYLKRGDYITHAGTKHGAPNFIFQIDKV